MKLFPYKTVVVGGGVQKSVSYAAVGDTKYVGVVLTWELEDLAILKGVHKVSTF